MHPRQWCGTVRYIKVSATYIHRYLTTWQLAFRQTVHEYGTDLCWTPMVGLSFSARRDWPEGDYGNYSTDCRTDPGEGV